ncbi:amino acid permease [Talaromyces proteolyticus]|uniref:Amino acid permease n=1 Tax=Talaromyces proteolyticus TaxID=1131652 RepID=A0AAD4PWP0_9EURO|nr:amino acid permease [Talaromyces proteolyticus]KAH8695305.1 amino acid permease [Talaromyces proteolyticus]
MKDEPIEVSTSPALELDSIAKEGEILETRHGHVVDHGLHRGLKGRHLQMMSLGGVVGASIWYGTGNALSNSGPVGALICFIVIGIDVFFVMQALGELATLYPTPGAFTELAGRFIDPSLSFALGWNYWYLWVTNIASEYNTFSIVLNFWTDKVPSYGWILIAWAFFQVLGLLGVVIYGELEFWLATWKIFCVLAGYIIAILVNTGAIGGDYIGFRYWKDPGPFAEGGINGFGQSFVLAAVYYCGTEMIAITAGESRNPKKHIPKAIRNTFFRILIIFLGLVFFASIIVPSNDPGFVTATSKSASSPYSLALQHAGWEAAPNLINTFIFTAVFSSINSSNYIASRTLLSLAQLGRAPRIFAKTTSRGVPIYAVIVTNTLGLIALINTGAGAGPVFTYLVTISGSATFIAWAFIGITHLRFRRAWKLQGRLPEDLPFRAWLYPWGTLFVVALNLFLVFIQGYSTLLTPWQPVAFVFNYIILVLFFGLWMFWKFWKKCKFVDLRKVDLNKDRRDVLDDTVEDEEVRKVSLFKRAVGLVRRMKA